MVGVREWEREGTRCTCSLHPPATLSDQSSKRGGKVKIRVLGCVLSEGTLGVI